LKVTLIEHKGKKFLFLDFKKLFGDDLLNVLHEAAEMFKTLKTPTPVLMDFTDCFTDQKFINEIQDLAKKYDSLILKSGNVGVVGIKKAIAVTVIKVTGQGNKSKFFDSIEDAKNFLAE